MNKIIILILLFLVGCVNFYTKELSLKAGFSDAVFETLPKPTPTISY